MPTMTLPTIDFSKFNVLKLNLPHIDLSKVELPKIDVPDIDADRIAAAARDAAYISIGFGVLAFQKAQVRRRDLMKQLQATQLPVDQIGEFIAAQLRGLDGVVEQLKGRLGHVGA